MVDGNKSPEVPRDRPFERRVRRTAWVLALALLALGILGVFGDGPVSNASDASSALRVQYERFLRRDSPMQLRIDARPAADAEARIAVSGDYLHALRIGSILPSPERLEETGEDVILVFRAAPGSESVRITLEATPLQVGKLHAHVRAVGDTQDIGVRINQFIWP
jgi:hypothetical protein